MAVKAAVSKQTLCRLLSCCGPSPARSVERIFAAVEVADHLHHVSDDGSAEEGRMRGGMRLVYVQMGTNTFLERGDNITDTWCVDVLWPHVTCTVVIQAARDSG
jgi:hypothetical protein